MEFCSGALRDRWLYSPSEALSALGRAWKVFHNEGVWGGGSLAGVGSIHWEESNTSPPSNSHSLLSVFLRLSKGWVEHEDPPLKCLMKNTSHLQQSTLSSFITNNLNNVLKKIIPTLNSDWMSQSSLNYCKIANKYCFTMAWLLQCHSILNLIYLWMHTIWIMHQLCITVDISQSKHKQPTIQLMDYYYLAEK